MAHYIVYFNQDWVGEHSAEWFASRGPLAHAVVEEIKAAGAYVYAAGVEEDLRHAFNVHFAGGEDRFAQGPFAPGAQRIGGLTIIDVADEAAARHWAGRIAQACGWPQEVRRLF